MKPLSKWKIRRPPNPTHDHEYEAKPHRPKDDNPKSESDQEDSKEFGNVLAQKGSKR